MQGLIQIQIHGLQTIHHRTICDKFAGSSKSWRITSSLATTLRKASWLSTAFSKAVKLLALHALLWVGKTPLQTEAGTRGTREVKARVQKSQGGGV